MRAVVGVVFPAQRVQHLRLGHEVVVTRLILDRLVGILQGFFEIDLLLQQVVGRVVPTFPRVLGQAAKLVVQILRHDFVRIDADLERNRNLLPTQRDHRGIRIHIVEVVGERFVKLCRLWLSP